MRGFHVASETGCFCGFRSDDLFRFAPVAVGLDEVDEPVERLLLRDVPFDDFTPFVERDAPGCSPDVAVIGVGHLARAVDDAPHDSDA